MNLMKALILILTFVLAVQCRPISEFEEEKLLNPFYVDHATIKKEENKWTMQVKNHNELEEDSATNPELKKASLTIESLDKKVLHLKMINATGKRWEAPLFNEHPGRDYSKSPMDQMGFSFEEDPFTFQIVDPVSKELLVSNKKALNGSLQFFDKYIEIGLWYPHKRIFGLGTRNTPDFELCHASQKCWYTLFTRGAWGIMDYGEYPGANQTYGAHPFYMIHLKNGKFLGVFLLTTNAQNIVLVKRPNDELNLYHKIIGGIIELYYFYPDQANNVLRRYHDLIGRPYMPPFWALGYHQSRWGWRTLDKVKSIVAGFEQADIPLEVVWGDIDYMDQYADFTVDPIRYKGLDKFVDDLHRRKMRWVPIVDAGLKYDPKNKYIIYGEKNHALIMSAKYKKPIQGLVWPGHTCFVDFLSPHGDDLWHMGFSDFYKLVKYDGIWIDMNEIVSKCDSECYKNEEEMTEAPSIPGDPHDPHEFDNLPYVPGGRFLDYRTLSMAGYHYSKNDEEDRLHKEYNLHSLWSTYEARSINNFFTYKLKKRPFTISRSSFAGAGMFTSVWEGDNWGRWDWMRYSIIYQNNFQMFGIPLVGADLCGYIANVTDELCARYMQLGSFSPFTRNHNAHDNRDKEPFRWPLVAMATRNALRQKYSLLHYYYTKLFECSLYGGGMIHPVFYEYPEDNLAYKSRNDTFLVGTSIMVAAALYKGATEVHPYCPNDDWYDLRTRKQLVKYDSKATEGKTLTLSAPFEYVNLLVRGGSIIPYQDALSARVRRTELLRYLPMEMLIVPDHNGKAKGSLIVDDGDSVRPIENKQYRHMTFTFDMKEKKLKVKMLNNYPNDFSFEKFSRLSIFGAEAWKQVKTAVIKSTMGGILAKVPGRFDPVTKALTFFAQKSQFNWKQIQEINFEQFFTH